MAAEVVSEEPEGDGALTPLLVLGLGGLGAAVLQSFRTALAERFGSPEALPPVELDLSKLPKGMPRIAGKEVKWEKGTEAYDATRSAVADLPEELARRIRETALAAYNALGLRDYGRIDLRVAPKGDIYVIEANPNPWLSPDAELALAAAAAGRDYRKLIGEIADRALARYL